MTLNGLPATAGRQIQFANASSGASRLRRSSLFTNGHAARSDRQLAAQLRHDQLRRAQAATQAAAGRRAVIAAALALLGMVAGAVVLVQEAGIQQVEAQQ